jgi:hypothetical protein
LLSIGSSFDPEWLGFPFRLAGLNSDLRQRAELALELGSASRPLVRFQQKGEHGGTLLLRPGAGLVERYRRTNPLEKDRPSSGGSNLT